MARWSFTEHPDTVGETYGEHLRSAWGFAWRMLAGGLACLVHGLVPFLFVTTGSSTVRGLHDRMVLSRSRARPDGGATAGREQPGLQATEGRLSQ